MGSFPRNALYSSIGFCVPPLESTVFLNNSPSSLLKIPFSLITLMGLSIMHGRLNAILSLILILIYFLKRYRSFVIIIPLIALFSVQIISKISSLNIGTVKRLLNDQSSIDNRIQLASHSIIELQNTKKKQLKITRLCKRLILNSYNSQNIHWGKA